MRNPPRFPRRVALAVTLAAAFTLAVPPQQGLALSVDTSAGTVAGWVPVGGSTAWEADLTVGGSAGRLGFSSSLGGDLSDASFSWNEADHVVTELIFTPTPSAGDTGAVSLLVDPELPDEASALRLRLGSLGLNFADATIDAGAYAWDGVEIDWASGDTVAVSLEEFPQHFTPRAFDGRRNNTDNPAWGSAGISLLKKAADAYADGVSSPTEGRPNARTISNLVFAQEESVTHALRGSDLVWQWGQFIDHDITLSPDNLDEAFSIAVPSGNSVFDPDGTGEMTIELHRSASDASTGTGSDNPRRQVNALTAFVDGSQVYGSDRARAGALRTNDGTGKLNTSGDGKFLPYNTGKDSTTRAGRTARTCFVAGDLRVNEQIGLIAMHTLFVREHNRLADLIAAENPDLSGDEIYELARKIVGACDPEHHLQRVPAIAAGSRRARHLRRATTPTSMRPLPASSRPRPTGSATRCCRRICTCWTAAASPSHVGAPRSILLPPGVLRRSRHRRGAAGLRFPAGPERGRAGHRRCPQLPDAGTRRTRVRSGGAEHPAWAATTASATSTPCARPTAWTR